MFNVSVGGLVSFVILFGTVPFQRFGMSRILVHREIKRKPAGQCRAPVFKAPAKRGRLSSVFRADAGHRSFSGSVGQSCSAAVASSLQNFTAVSGRHSLSEAVDFFSVQFFRLVGSFHGAYASF